ncbi:hypothetical protein O3M35_008638 [Rhynocoris fuscipes]|uniref:Vacuolar protein sorting-associated protein 33B n=1 Tax=Rhynocoris fuscipes TaxID=488301 RepID=A0AAW1D7M8_9HEMI
MQYSLDQKLSALGQISQEKLLTILKEIHGKKDFIIEPSLIKPLERFIGVTKLRSSGVDKIYKLEKVDTPFTNTQRVFFITDDLITVKQVCDKISGEISQNNDGNSYHIILISRKLGSITHLLEEEGIYGYISLHSFHWELIQLDTRILSLEAQNFYKNVFVEGDQSALSRVARSVWTLQMLFGKPPICIYQGKYSQKIEKMVEILHEELGGSDRLESDVSCLVMVDRDLDYASTLLTGGTYTSLLDEVLGINSGVIEVKSNNKDGNPVSSLLTSSDEIYSQIRSRHFSDVFPFLRTKTKELNAVHQKSQTMAIQEMKRYISQELPSVTNTKKKVAYHITACECIISQMGNRFEGLQNTEKNMLDGRSKRETITYIEDCLAMNVCDKYSILRLLCLLSITQDGLLQDELQKLKIQFLHMYGYQHLPLFHRLEKTGLCTEQANLITTDVKGGHLANKVVQAVPLPTRRSTFTAFAQKLKLFPYITDGYDLKNPKDMGYVFSGSYIPVVCQLIHLLIKKEMPFEDIIKMIPHCTYTCETPAPQALRTFIVYFVGGVTYAEISAFQLLEKLTGATIIVAGTSIMNGNTLMKAFF